MTNPKPRPVVRFKQMLIGLALLALLYPLTTQMVVAQEAAPPASVSSGGSQGSTGFGINAVSAHYPQEEDLSDIGGLEEVDKFELFFDWNWLRLGYNMTHAAMSFSAYNQSWETRMKKRTTYAAYRMSSADSQAKWDLFMLAGLAYTDASFAITNISNQSSSDLGYVVGGGAFYIMGKLSMGMELLIISTQGDFDGVQIATGSTQILSGFKYNF